MVKITDSSYVQEDGSKIAGIALMIDTTANPLDYTAFAYDASMATARANMRSRLMELYAEIGEAIEQLK